MHCSSARLPWTSETVVALCAGLLALALVPLSGPAQAANYSMTGFYRDIRGPISLPVADTISGVGRGVHGAGSVSQTGPPVPGGGPATLVIPTNVFNDPPQLGGFLIPLPSIIQVTTLIAHSGPSAPATLMASRSGLPSFAFCPGAAANPYCTTASAGGTQGTVNGIVRYTAGPNRFGGTFRMLAHGSGNVTNKGGPLPPTVMTASGATKAALPFSAINYNLGGSSMIPAGRSYGAMAYVYLAPSPATHPYGYQATPKGLLSRGPFVGTGISATNAATGFPMTTGQVYLYRKIASQATGPAPPSKHTVTGYDKRTPGGVGRLALVAGSLSRVYPAGGVNPPEGSAVNQTRMILSFVPQPALSLASPTARASLGALILIGAGYAFFAGRVRRV